MQLEQAVISHARAHTLRNAAINPTSNVVDIVLFYTLRNDDINRVSFT